MRNPFPLHSDFVIKQLDQFASGSLVFLLPYNANSSYNTPAEDTKAAIVVNVTLNGGVRGVFLMEDYTDGMTLYPKGAFIYSAGTPEPFNLQTLGIETLATVEVDQAVRFQGGPISKPGHGKIGFAATGSYLSTFTPDNVRGVLDPATWSIDANPQSWPQTFTTAAGWQAVWKCASGAEVLVPF